jgi:O-antigen/teichoic acid export membrane protein
VSQRIAVGTFSRAVGEVVGKVASLVLYVAIARELGEALFGDYVFALSLSTVLMLGAGLGLQELLAREVAKDAGRIDDLFWNVLAIRAITVVPLVLVVALVGAARGHSVELGAAAAAVATAVGLELVANAYYAVFQGVEKNHHVATSLIVNRISTTVMAIIVLAAGGGLLPVAAVVALGSLFGVVTAYVLMRHDVARPAFEVEPRRWPQLIRVGFPLGLTTILNQSLLRLNVVILGFIAGSAAVGEYGAAARLIDATMFVPWAFGGAILPWFSRHTGQGPVTIARGLEIVTKTMVALTLPVALVFVVYADALIDALYGSGFGGGVSQLQLLAGMTVLYALISVATTVLIGRDRPQDFTKPAAIVLVVSIALSLALIPPYEGDGAAISLVVSSALLLVLTMRNLVRTVGAVSPLKVLLAPLASGAAMLGTAYLLSEVAWVPAAVVALAVYALAFLAVERILFPADFAFYSGMFRRATAASG